jgi:hypothetical protein
MTMGTPPHRPQSAKDSELGFTKARPTNWLSPGMLVNTAGQVLLSDVFGEYLDKRDLQKSLPATVFQELGDGQELWFDFVADLGDGFDPTYSIAYLLAQEELTVEGHDPLPRGSFLMMGGDEIYPTPTWERYQSKTKGPYEAALPEPPADGVIPNLYALPGNHDWYDGLTSFMRLFAKAGKHDIGGWRAPQARSYFAIELPQRWWLFAIDTQFGEYIDDAQLAYFHAAAAKLTAGDRVILCAPTPAWVEATHDPGAYDAIDFFVRTVLNPAEIEIALMLSGDLHHYARYTGTKRQLIHCGGGGAYLYPTHRMPAEIPVPPPAGPIRSRSEETSTYELASVFPSKSRSRRYAGGVFGRVPTRNPGFVGLLGGVQALLMCSLLGIFDHVSEVTQRWLEIPIALMVILIMTGTILFAKSPTGGTQNLPTRWTLGIIHGLVQVGLGLAATWWFVKMPYLNERWPLPILGVIVYGVVLGIVSTLIFCLYMLIASSLGVNVNELFSGQSIIDSKSFLRLHIAADGTLTVYPVAVPKVARKWFATPDAAPTKPWLEPVKPIGYELIEAPITIGGLAQEARSSEPRLRQRPAAAQPTDSLVNKP